MDKQRVLLRKPDKDSSLFDVLLSATAERKLSGGGRDTARDNASKQTIYDVIIDATISKLGSWKKITPEDALKVSQEKSVLDTYNHVSSIFQV